MYEFTTSLDWVPPKPWSDQNLDNGVERIKDFFLSIVQYTAGLFAAISIMIYTTMGAKCISKIIGSGRRMIMMMQPSKVLTCVSLVTCFAGHADATSVYYERGLCLTAAAGLSNGCNAKEITGSLQNYTGPMNCTSGETFNYSVALKIVVGSNGKRCDLGAYFGLDGVNAENATGASCLVQVLDGTDVGATNEDFDTCWDNDSQNIITSFEVTDLTTTCSNPSSNGKVTVSVCFVWSICGGNNAKNCTDPYESTCAAPSTTACLLPNPDTVSYTSHLVMD